MSEETVTISRKEYDELLDDVAFLYALQSAGVDNWEGMEEAMAILRGEY